MAVIHYKRGRGLIKINSCPVELVLRFKVVEPILLLGRQCFVCVDLRIRVKGGGHTLQIYAIRQSIAKALVAFLFGLDQRVNLLWIGGFSFVDAFFILFLIRNIY